MFDLNRFRSVREIKEDDLSSKALKIKRRLPDALCIAIPPNRKLIDNWCNNIHKTPIALTRWGSNTCKKYNYPIDYIIVTIPSSNPQKALSILVASIIELT